MAIAGGMIAASLVSGIMAKKAADEAREEAKRNLEEGKAQYGALSIPSIEEQQVNLRQLTLAGVISPEQEQAISQDPSAMLKVATDPRLKDAQMQALQQMSQVSREGITPTEQAALQQVRTQVNQQDTARRQALLQNMASRGMAGSGAELAAQLQGAQAAAEQQSGQGLNIAAQAQARALQAMTGAGTMSGQMRSQDFGEQAAKAQAADEVAKFNALQRAGSQQRNVGSQLAAQ